MRAEGRALRSTACVRVSEGHGRASHALCLAGSRMGWPSYL